MAATPLPPALAALFPGVKVADIDAAIDDRLPKTVRWCPWLDATQQLAIHGAPENKRRIVPAQNKFGKRIILENVSA